MEDYQKCLILLSLIIMYFYYINNRKETFENLDSFIKSTNNGQWNFSSYNPYQNLNEYTDSFILLYSDTSSDSGTSDSPTDGMGQKELLKYNKEQLKVFKDSTEFENQIKNLLNKYNNSDNTIKNIEKRFRKLGMEYVYTVPLTTAYDKLNYIKNKTRLKTSINNFLIKDLKKYVIEKYIEPKSITNQIDTDNSIVVKLEYKLNATDINNFDTYKISILKKIKKYLKFDIINNGTNYDNTNINIQFKIINYDNNQNIVAIINDKLEKLYKILFTDILNTNDDNNILRKINSLTIESENTLRYISLYGYDTDLKINNIDISPNCSVPNGKKTILNRYKISERATLSGKPLKTVTLKARKQSIIDSIRTDKYDTRQIADVVSTNPYTPLDTASGNHISEYNCNVYDIKYNLDGNKKYILDIYDDYNHFDSTKSNNGITAFKYKKDDTASPPHTSHGILNSGNVDRDLNPTSYTQDTLPNKRQNNFDSNFKIEDTSTDNSCNSQSVDTTSSQIKTQLQNLNNIKGLDKKAKDNVKAILYANLSLEEFKNHINTDLKNKNRLIRLRTLGKAFKFLDEIKTLESLTISIFGILKQEIESSLNITEDKLVGAVYYIIEKHIRENNNEFFLKEKLLFNNELLQDRSIIIQSYIPETPNSEIEKLFFMTTQEKVDYFDKDTTINAIELEVKLIEKMRTSELENYFKEINNNAINNNLEKDVNDRLKAIITTNSNNITRIHKKLNNLAGGVKKISGGNLDLSSVILINIPSITSDGNTLEFSDGDTSSAFETSLENIKDNDIVYFNKDIDSLPRYKPVRIIRVTTDNPLQFKLQNIDDSSDLTFDTNISLTDTKIYKINSYSPSTNVDGLLLNNYNNMSLKEVTSNLNHIAYYKDKLYIIGNSGYFTVYDLSKNTNKTPILYESSTTLKMLKIYENLNFIHITKNGQCAIVGNNGTIIYNSDLNTRGEVFIPYIKKTDKNFKECLLHDNNLYFITNTDIYSLSTTLLGDNELPSSINVSGGFSSFENLFIDLKNTNNIYCFSTKTVNGTKTKNLIRITPTTSPGASTATGFTIKYSEFMSYNADIFIKYNSHTNIIYNDNFIRNKINFDIITSTLNTESSLALNYKRVNSFDINTNDKLSSVFINNVNIGGISDKLVYYSFNNNNQSNYYNINIKANSNDNIEKGKLYCLPNINDSYSNIFHYGSAGQIINYNINNLNKNDIIIEGNNVILSGYDNSNNAVFTFNTSRVSKKFNITYFENSSSTTSTIRLSGNQNSYIYGDNKRIIRYNDYDPDISNYEIRVFSIVNENYVIRPLITNSETNKAFDLLSNTINIEINKYTEINKNEFVSVALFVNDKFKIWLRPESDSDFNSYIHKLSFNNNTTNKFVVYVNGFEKDSYILNKPVTESSEIAAILYNGENIYNNNSIDITDIVGDSITLLVVPVSQTASVFYNKSISSTKEITNIDKNAKSITIGIKNNDLFKSHRITIVSSNKVYTNLRDYEISYLLDIDVNKAYNYLRKVKKPDLTTRYLLEKYRTAVEDDIQIYLALIKNETDRNNVQNRLINAFTDSERSDYIKKYLDSNIAYNIPENTSSDKIVEEKQSEQEQLLKSLKIKLDKMKIEKEILSNQYKIEQRNRMFESLDADKLVKKEDIDKLETEIIDIDKIIKESETKTTKSKSFLDKLLGFFTSEEKEDFTLIEKLTEADKQTIIEKKKELEKQIEEMDKLNEEEISKKQKANEDKIKKMEEEYKVNLEKLKLENKVKLERARSKFKKSMQDGETDIVNTEINDDLEIKKDIIQNEKINLEMDKLFNVQKNLIKKQKSLLKIIKPQLGILEEINKKNEDEKVQGDVKTKAEADKAKADKAKADKAKTDKVEADKAEAEKQESIIQSEENDEKINIANEPDIEETQNLIKDLSTQKVKKEKNNIKTDILEELDKEIKKEKEVKKGKKPCVSFIDCYFKGLDDSFYTSYKKENTFIKDASLPKTKKPTCKPKKDCDVCYLETNGVPNSITYNNSKTNNGLDLTIKGNTNAHFLNDYDELPDCPFDSCMSCENINNYSLFNNKTFNDKLIKKYTRN